MLLQGRVAKICLIEKVLLGRSVFEVSESTKDINSFIGMVNDLDKDWFNYMPNSFFIDKYKEEINEFKDALASYYFNKDKINDCLVESLRYNVVAELSDAILATSSALAEHKVEEAVVVSTMRDLVAYCLELADRYGEEIILETIEPEELFKAHYVKINEMCVAKNIYRSIVDGENIDEAWAKTLLKLYTIEEFREPKNKMKIVKEIRRMLFAISHIDK
ncbi:MAG: hypothetical protein ACRCX8_04980 [Sarcina sp.]